MEMVMQPAGANPGVVVDTDKESCKSGHGHGHMQMQPMCHGHHGGHKDDHHCEETVQRHGLANLDHQAHHGHEIRNSIEHHGVGALHAIKDSLKDLLIHNSNQHMQLQMKLAEEFRESQVEAAKNHGLAQLESAKQFAAIQLEAQKVKSELKDELCKAQACCAETKQLIVEKACDTEKLIRDQEAARLAAEVAKLHEELTALRIRATLLPAPVAATCL